MYKNNLLLLYLFDCCYINITYKTILWYCIQYINDYIIPMYIVGHLLWCYLNIPDILIIVTSIHTFLHQFAYCGVILTTTQFLIYWLNELAFWNISAIVVTFCIAHPPIPWLKVIASLKHLDVSVTFLVFQYPMRELNMVAPSKVPLRLVIVSGSQRGTWVSSTQSLNPSSSDISPLSAHVVVVVSLDVDTLVR